MRDINSERKTKIVFFDTTWNQLFRFGSVISAYIKENNDDVETVGVVCEEITGRIAEHLFDSVYANASNLAVAEYVSKTKPDIAVFVQNTIADQNVIMRAKKCGAMVFVLQHGMLYKGDSLNNFDLKEVLAAARNLKKTIKYLITLKQMCKYDGRSYVGLIKQIVCKRKDVVRIVQNYFSIKLNGDYAMVIGPHWINYYCECYDYQRDQVFLMGNHDVDDLELDRSLEDAICYIPSVHVEDGKVRASVFNKFVEALAEAVDINDKLYIKMHPRGNIDLYKDAFSKHNVTYITEKELPYVTTYIGHNSTLLSKAFMLTNKVIIWGFKMEDEQFYKQWAYSFCTTPDELKAAVRRAVSDKTSNADLLNAMRQISYINPEGAFHFAASKIMELYRAKVETD